MSNKIKRDNQWYENNKEKILDLYYNSNKSLQDICDELICGRSRLIDKIKEWNVPKRPRVKHQTRYNALYNIDYEYFDNIDCEHKAYWLGFLLADGYVDERKIMIGLQKKDIDTIEKFKSDIQSEHPIRIDSHGNPTVTIVCKTICDKLIEYGFHNRKSWSFDMNKILLVIPSEYENHFIRGMFDGDGSIKYYKYDYQDVPFYHCGYTGLKNVCEYVANKLGITRFVQERNASTYTIITSNPQKIMEIYCYLYNNATVYMQRKYDTFQEIIQIEKERAMRRGG